MKNELIIFAAAIALLAGCSKEEGAPAAERPCIRLSTGVEAAKRATDVAFEEGDNFGLIVLSRTSETAPSLDGARYLNNGLCTQTAEGVEMPNGTETLRITLSTAGTPTAASAVCGMTPI